MATYQELFELKSDSALRNRVEIAVWVAAETIRTEDGATANHLNRLDWSRSALANPDRETARMFSAVLAANRALTPAQIREADDAQIQTCVLAAVDLFAVEE